MSKNKENPNKLTGKDKLRLAELVFTCTIRSWMLYFLVVGVLVFRLFSTEFAILWGIVCGICLLIDVFHECLSCLPDALEAKLSVALEPTMIKAERFLEIAEDVAEVVQDIQYEVEDDVDEVMDFVEHVHFTVYDRFLRIKYALRDKLKARIAYKKNEANKETK